MRELDSTTEAFLKSVSYKPTVLPALPEGASSAARLRKKIAKASRLLFQAGPCRLFKAVHRKVVFGDIRRCCTISTERRHTEEAVNFRTPVVFSILVPLYNTPLPFLDDMIASVQAQTYPHWELCLADGSDDAHGEVGRRCNALAANDRRIIYKKLERNGGIAENTNACIAMATGQFISLFDHDDILHPSALFETMKAIEEQHADMVYTDEATFVKHRFITMLTYHYKPDYSVDSLRANNYICHFTSFSRKLLEKAGLFRHEYDGSQDHDMILRLSEQATHIVHIPKLLYFWRSHKASVASDINSKPYAIAAGQRAVHDSVVRVTGQECTVTSSRAFPAIYNIRYTLNTHPTVSVILPTNGDQNALTRSVASLLTVTTYRSLELIVACNDPSTVSEDIAALPNVRVLSYRDADSRESLINHAVHDAVGEYLVLLNNYAEIITSDWVEQLLMLAQRDDVGAVGGKLLHPNGSIHHAGYVLGLGRHRTVGNVHHGLPYIDIGHRGQLCFVRDVSAVSTDFMMLRRSLFEEVGGLDESLSASHSDADLCLKLRKTGLLNTFTPHAESVLHAPCKATEDSEAVLRFRTRWQDVLNEGDPYFSPHFSLDHPTVWLR